MVTKIVSKNFDTPESYKLEVAQKNGVYGSFGPWQCQNKTTLLANNQTLSVPLTSGRYILNIAAVMRKGECDIAAYKAGQLIDSPVYTTTDFMVINHTNLNSSNANLAQDTTKTKIGPRFDDVLAKYDLNLNWPAVEGADAYQIKVIKNNIAYSNFNGYSNPISVNNLNGTQFTVRDEFFPGDTVENGSFNAIFSFLTT